MMGAYGRIEPWGQHAKELKGAALLCREWAQEISSTNS
jgi:hypothetical protein